jgi:hypothetical protein
MNMAQVRTQQKKARSGAREISQENSGRLARTAKMGGRRWWKGKGSTSSFPTFSFLTKISGPGGGTAERGRQFPARAVTQFIRCPASDFSNPILRFRYRRGSCLDINDLNVGILWLWRLLAGGRDDDFMRAVGQSHCHGRPPVPIHFRAVGVELTGWLTVDGRRAQPLTTAGDMR